MKFRFPLSLPSRADGTFLPAGLASVLVLALAAQLLAAGDGPELPPAPAVGAARSNFQAPVYQRVGVPPAIFSRPLFGPRQPPTIGDGAPPPAIGGATVAGTMSVRGRTYAVIRRGNGAVINLRVGGSVEGWRLLSLGPSGAVFQKANDKRTIAYGGSGLAQPAAEVPEQ